MNLKAFHNIYFIGIGGIGMSALASYFMRLKKLFQDMIKPQAILQKYWSFLE